MIVIKRLEIVYNFLVLRKVYFCEYELKYYLKFFFLNMDKFFVYF